MNECDRFGYIILEDTVKREAALNDNPLGIVIRKMRHAPIQTSRVLLLAPDEIVAVRYDGLVRSWSNSHVFRWMELVGDANTELAFWLTSSGIDAHLHVSDDSTYASFEFDGPAHIGFQSVDPAHRVEYNVIFGENGYQVHAAFRTVMNTLNHSV